MEISLCQDTVVPVPKSLGPAQVGSVLMGYVVSNKNIT